MMLSKTDDSGKSNRAVNPTPWLLFGVLAFVEKQLGTNECDCFVRKSIRPTQFRPDVRLFAPVRPMTSKAGFYCYGCYVRLCSYYTGPFRPMTNKAGFYCYGCYVRPCSYYTGPFRPMTNKAGFYCYGCYVWLCSYYYCGRQEEPAILISRLLLRMRHMYVASIRLDFHWEWMEYTKRDLITRVSTFYPS